MKILVTGANGFLGKKICNILSEKHEIIPTDINTENSIDIINKDEVFWKVKEIMPEIIINSAAYTNVDACEDNKDLASKINTEGPENLALVSKEINAKLVHISTDFVFDGEKGNYTEEDEPNPVDYYGVTKLNAEKKIANVFENYLILRTCVLYGHDDSEDKQTFINWVINHLGPNKELSVVDDQTVSPTLIDDLAKAIEKLIEKNEKGLFHVVGSEIINRYELAKKIQKVFELEGNIIATNSESLHQKAERPRNSSLKIDKLNSIGINMHNVEEGLKIMKEQINQILEE